MFRTCAYCQVIISTVAIDMELLDTTLEAWGSIHLTTSIDSQALWHRMQIAMQLAQALITVADANAIKGKRVLINNCADKDSRVLTASPGQWHCLNYKASL